MDMTGNDNWLLNVHYTGTFSWGEVDTRATYQTTQHTMDMGADRYSYGTGMPMDTKAKTRGGSVQARMPLSEKQRLRVGVELQYHTLYDWWPPVGGTMGPNALWNVDYGQRLRLGAYAEWEASLGDRWTALAGLRSDLVKMDAAPVQGYDNGLAGSWGNDAIAFNARQRARTDPNWDASAQVRFSPGSGHSYEAGYGRKSRSPGLYQRYPWSTNAMAALMNNLVGDGNGYVGRVDLRPEVAHNVSLTGEWHEAAYERWRARVSVYYTHVDDYIDAERCGFGQCSAANLSAKSGFVLLQFVNQEARLYGADVSAQVLLLEQEALGSLTATAIGSVVRGANLSTGDYLYGVMPPTATVTLAHRLGWWSASAELLLVADKERVSQVRNELRTGGYGLVNLRASYEWKHARVDLSALNLFDRAYASPLGGAYVGQGPSMSLGSIPWGVPVPGPGRSIDLALNLRF
jgi:iron complex outermembrane receptor protein